MGDARLTFGSLFAGIGGFDLGFQRAGMECKWQVEIDDYATRVLAKHWPDVRRHRDICTFPPKPVDDWRVDVVCGGFPCQDISYAGKGAGLDGERSGLFYEAMRAVRVLGPSFVVLENVAALLTRGIAEVLGTLASLGFDAEWHCVPAAAVGAPHIRDRVFIIAYRDCCGFTGLTEQDGSSPGGQQAPRWNHAGRLCDDVADAEQLQSSERHNADVQRRRSEQAEYAGLGGGREPKPKCLKRFCRGRLRWYDIGFDRGWKCDRCGAIWEPHEVGVVPNDNGQGPQERSRQDSAGKRPQEWPELSGGEWWEIEPDVGRVVDGFPGRVDRLRCLGNAVVPQVAEWIGRRIVESVQ